MENIKKQATQVILEAGGILLDTYKKPKNVSHKGRRDLVTDTDSRLNQFLMEKLTKICDSGFLGEEGSTNEEKATRWIVDPIDGTTNFVHSYPMFCISIGLEIDNNMELGLIYIPVLNTLYHTRKGHGAWENDKQIHVSDTNELIDGLMATGFPYKDSDLKRVLQRLENMIRNCQGIRRSGSAAIDMCHVASGYVDGFWEQGLKPWDTSAGMLLIREAGGRLTNYDGDDYSYNHETIIASNSLLHSELLEVLKV